jgi:hypothetical protein
MASRIVDPKTERRARRLAERASESHRIVARHARRRIGTEVRKAPLREDLAAGAEEGRRVGDSRRPPGPDFGDGFSRALVQEPLLFEGRNFAKTDVRAA